MFLNPVDDQEIIRTVQSCKHKMSTDYNDINMSMVKQIINQIVRPFVHIYAMYLFKRVYFQTK